MSSHFAKELEALPETYLAAMASNVESLKSAIDGASDSSLISVGSGGSFTSASLLCNLHEYYTGNVSRASTPLEIICNPTLAASSPVFLISAEGKNPDITEALLRAREKSSRPIHVITNRKECKLINAAEEFNGITSHIFELSAKDGYLATNSLLYDTILIARAYEELNNHDEKLPDDINKLRIGKLSIKKWIDRAGLFIEECVCRKSIIIIFSPLLRPIAQDLESKLSEAALLHVQFTDMRSFAHGRHLWLANRPNECTILSLNEPSIGKLWQNTCSLFPNSIPTMSMDLGGASPHHLIAGLVAQLHLISNIGIKMDVDPGKPSVPEFGSKLHYANLTESIPESRGISSKSNLSKYEILGAKWPSKLNPGTLKRARDAFVSDLENQIFRAVVFDYDGTLCESGSRQPPPEYLLKKLEKIAENKIVIGIASGRGGSIAETLKTVLSKKAISQIELGLYNGGKISKAELEIDQDCTTSEFLSHVTRIIVRLKALGVPILKYRTTQPYQVSVRFRHGLSTDKMWFVIADAMNQEGLEISSIVKSKHSIDILAPGINKSKLIAHIIQNHSINPYEIITVGDQGAWPGNDSVLLEHKYSISVDLPSRHLDRGWKLAPDHKRNVDATIWYLERFILSNQEKGYFKYSETNSS